MGVAGTAFVTPDFFPEIEVRDLTNELFWLVF